MEYEMRSIADAELEEFRRCQGLAFGNEINPEHLEAGRQVFEADRSLAVFDHGQIVGTAGIFSYEMTVPGEVSVPTAGVTMVSVKPTHRRRGILSGLMRRQLSEVRARGEAVAILWASESVIYGRFGYGVAMQQELLRIPHEYRGLRDDSVLAPGRVRLITQDEARVALPQAHGGMRLLTPGAVGRSEKWWEVRIFRDHPDHRGGFGSNNYLVYEEDGVVRGYLVYRRKGDFQDWIPAGTVLVTECFSEHVRAYAGLWRYVLGLDLVKTVEYGNAGMDEPLLWMLEDARRTERKRLDGIWLRIVDIEKALSARHYGGEGRIVFEVRDNFLNGTGGRFELEASPEGGVCRRTDTAPELVLGPEELANLYLGGGSAGGLARAGRIQGDARALALADRIFGWHVLPHCQEHF
ncbi:MAG: GNAT family N-acetyltransferase [Chloroflexi bacterium]|nr:GNAT family N-acetyltransferase [Chloroflexota bacterium]